MIDYTQALVPFTHRLAPVDDFSSRYSLRWTHPVTTPMRFESHARAALLDLQQQYQAETSSNASSPRSDDDTTLFPVIQSGVLGVTQEEQAIDTLFQSLSSTSSTSTVDLTSGYFGLYEPYKRRILRSPNTINWRIVAAGPLANGFYGSKGLSGLIPEAYTWFERRFWKAGVKVGKIGPAAEDSRIEIREWERPGWTYHAKGVYPDFVHPV